MIEGVNFNKILEIIDKDIVEQKRRLTNDFEKDKATNWRIIGMEHIKKEMKEIKKEKEKMENNKIAEKRLKIIEKQEEDKFKLQVENKIIEEKLMSELYRYLSKGVCPKCGGNVIEEIFKYLFLDMDFKYINYYYKCNNCKKKYRIKIKSTYF